MIENEVILRNLKFLIVFRKRLHTGNASPGFANPVNIKIKDSVFQGW
jgi:hypothetical protein